MKKFLHLKQILALSTFIFLTPLQSDSTLSPQKASIACATCQQTWYSPYMVCSSGCNKDKPRPKENLLCRKGCTSKYQKHFSTCVEKAELSKPACPFQAVPVTQSPPKTPRGTWAPKSSPPRSAKQYLSGSGEPSVSPPSTPRGTWAPRTPGSAKQIIGSSGEEDTGEDTGGSDSAVTPSPSKSSRKKWDKTPPRINSLAEDIKKNQ